MNTQNSRNEFSVIFSANGWTPSVQNQNSAIWFDFMQAGYEIMFSGTKRRCQEFFEEYMAEHLLTQD